MFEHLLTFSNESFFFSICLTLSSDGVFCIFIFYVFLLPSAKLTMLITHVCGVEVRMGRKHCGSNYSMCGLRIKMAYRLIMCSYSNRK